MTNSSSITPAMAPPAGMVSNFVDPPSCGLKFLVVNCVFLPLAVIALVVRMWTRIYLVRSVSYDDCRSPSLRSIEHNILTILQTSWLSPL